MQLLGQGTLAAQPGRGEARGRDHKMLYKDPLPTPLL